MPRNPSKKQQEASANNLKGKWGPKTIAGKKASSSNGKFNKGPKSTKEKAKIIYARWGSLKGTFYDRSECLLCQMNCKGKSFSKKAQLKDYSLMCFDKIINEYPTECFYYFRGLCGVRYANPELTGSYCILNDQNLREFSPYGDEMENNQLEVIYRLRFLKYKSIIERNIASQGNDIDGIYETNIGEGWTVGTMLKTFKLCMIEKKEISAFDKIINDLYFFR